MVLWIELLYPNSLGTPKGSIDLAHMTTTIATNIMIPQIEINFSLKISESVEIHISISSAVITAPISTEILFLARYLVVEARRVKYVINNLPQHIT